MPLRHRILLSLSLPPILTYLTAQHYSTLYPSRPESTGSLALRTPSNPSTQHCRDIDIDVFSARIPLKYLKHRLRKPHGDTSNPTPADLQEAWARTIIGGYIYRAEGCLSSFVERRAFDAGDVGDSEAGFAPVESDGRETDRVLLNGLCKVRRPPDKHSQPGSLNILDDSGPAACIF